MPSVLLGLCLSWGAVNAQSYYGDRVPGRFDQLSRKMRRLVEDVPVEVPDC